MPTFRAMSRLVCRGSSCRWRTIADSSSAAPTWPARTSAPAGPTCWCCAGLGVRVLHARVRGRHRLLQRPDGRRCPGRAAGRRHGGVRRPGDGRPEGGRQRLRLGRRPPGREPPAGRRRRRRVRHRPGEARRSRAARPDLGRAGEGADPDRGRRHPGRRRRRPERGDPARHPARSRRPGPRRCTRQPRRPSAGSLPPRRHVRLSDATGFRPPRAAPPARPARWCIRRGGRACGRRGSRSTPS